MFRPAAFLDRDGTLNVDKGYVFRIDDFTWLNSSKEAIKFLNESGYYVFVITNQSGIGRGYYTFRDLIKLHKYMNDDLSKMSARIDDFFYSPYHPDNVSDQFDHLSNLRKPNTGMLELAFMKWKIDKNNSFMIGNMQHDIECGEKFGIKGYLFNQKTSSLFEMIQKIIS